MLQRGAIARRDDAGRPIDPAQSGGQNNPLSVERRDYQACIAGPSLLAGSLTWLRYAVPVKVLFREEWEISSYLDLLARRLETRNIPVRTSTSLRRFAANDCDIVHYHIPEPSPGSRPWRRLLWVTLFALQVTFYKGTGKRIVWTAHDLTDRTYDTRERTTINAYLLYTADAIICHCRRVRDALIARRPQVTEWIFVVPHPTLVGVSQEATPARVAARPWGSRSRVACFFSLGQ